MIQVKKINPQGYCNGVKRALSIVFDVINEASTPRPIYLLGQLIHNSFVIEELRIKGIIIIEDKQKSRLELLDEIHSGTVIFSAHGVSPNVHAKARSKGLHIVDASCPNVLIIHKKIAQHLEEGYDCIYIGTKNHPECEGVLGISDKIHFVTSIDDIQQLKIQNNRIYTTNQTTLSTFDLKDIFYELEKKFPSILIDDKICNATTIRQEAMAKQEPADLCIVVGDRASSNTKKLAKVSQEIAGIPTLLCEDISTLDMEYITRIKPKQINISSGASTPSILVDEIIQKISKISD